MDENEREYERIKRRTQNQSINLEKKDSFFTVTIFQTFLCLVMIIIVVVISKTGGETKVKLQNDFSNLMSRSILQNDGADAINTIKEFLSEPFELLPALSPVSPIEQITEPTTETAQTTNFEETTVAVPEGETALEETEAETEAEAETQDTTGNMGGVDIELYKAAEGTTFSPVATTSAVLAPVESTKYTSYFGYRTNPITNKKSFHTGLDIAAPLGTKIRAAYNGTVRKVGEDNHSGKYIFLKHDDGFETFYCHCSEILAEEGAVIRQGETIALVGSTGWSTGPHLHFEVRKNGERVNPLGILENDN